MSELFEITELVKIGVEDEKSGVAFYSVMAEKAAKPELKKIFTELAEQERFHRQRFEQMLRDLGGHQPSREEYAGQYMEYLKALTNDRAFPDEDAARKAAEQCEDDAAAVDMAVRFERDTLLLMNEMRGMVPEKHAAIVKALADEEQAHLVTLSEARRVL